MDWRSGRLILKTRSGGGGRSWFNIRRAFDGQLGSLSLASDFGLFGNWLVNDIGNIGCRPSSPVPFAFSQRPSLAILGTRISSRSRNCIAERIN
jgi:hypothetical protein